MCSLCTPQFVLRPPFSKNLVISPPITGFWAATALGSSSCVWCSHAFGHRVLWSLQHLVQSLLLPQGLPQCHMVRRCVQTLASGHVEEGQTTPCAEKSHNCTEGWKVR